ncbi:DNA polymerase III subunit chi [Pseudomethylobacillus aquaticus]
MAMTRIEFFFNVSDKLQHALQLSAKALGKRRKLLIYAQSAAEAQRFQHLLWTQDAVSFHANCSSDDALAAETPLVVMWQEGALPHDDILVNLQAEQPLWFSRFTRLIEIVGVDEADKAAARQRYRFYRDRGYEIRSFDANGGALV